MKKSVMKKWVKALRSGKYKQGRGALKRGGEFCCLGVLCDISGKGGWSEHPLCEGTRYLCGDLDWSIANVPTSVKRWAGLMRDDGGIVFGHKYLSLVTLNDERKRSFKQIAAFIERNWEKL